MKFIMKNIPYSRRYYFVVKKRHKEEEKVKEVFKIEEEQNTFKIVSQVFCAH